LPQVTDVTRAIANIGTFPLKFLRVNTSLIARDCRFSATKADGGQRDLPDAYRRPKAAGQEPVEAGAPAFPEYYAPQNRAITRRRA
jgi:hypothetical protein